MGNQEHVYAEFPGSNTPAKSHFIIQFSASYFLSIRK